MRATALVISISVALLGCASAPAPSPQELAVADFGPPPKNYQQSILTYMQGHLRDPDSARYGFFKLPTKGYAGRQRNFGWIVCATVNSRNGFGGYAGARPYFFLIRNDQVIDTLRGDGQGMWLDGDIYRTCERGGW